MAATRINPQRLWIAHLISLFVLLAVIISDILPIPARFSGALAVLWFGLFAVHTVVLGYLPKPAEEKPKRRVSLSDDGELIEETDEAEEADLHAQMQSTTQKRQDR